MGRLIIELNAHAFMAMKDLPWKKYLHGQDHEAIMKAYKTEWDALNSTVLVELDPAHSD